MVLTQLIDDVVSRSDLVITSFDTLEPRLTVQLAAAKHGRSLIDVAVGVNDGEIRIWYPGSELACLGCYIVQKPSEIVGRSIYVSKPHLAAVLAGLAVEEALNIPLDRKPEYNRVKVVLWRLV